MGSHQRNLQKLFTRFTVGDVVKEKKVLHTVVSTTSIQDTMKLLEKHKIQSVPVIHEGTNKFMGIVSISDIALSVAFRPCYTREGEDVHHLTKKEMEEILKSKGEKLAKPIADIMGLTEEGKYFCVLGEPDPIGRAFHNFSEGAHRALVLRKGDAGPCMLSQTDVARFLLDKLKSEPASHAKASVEKLMNTKISEVPRANSDLSKGKIVSVNASEAALVGFRKLVQYHFPNEWNLAAIPVVSDDDGKGGGGKVVETLSSSDLRGLEAEVIMKLMKPIPEYLEELHGTKARKQVTVQGTTTFGEALRKV
uniref:CBS domain-containing protein n=1 Tax=Lotharella globosa TaxID=91324 RepID=A0A7S3YYK0_9EUKA